MLKEIKEVLDYIDGEFINDAHNSVESVKKFLKENVELAFEYIIYTNQKDFIQTFLMYLSFVPYDGYQKKAIDLLIKKYPNDGYEVDEAVLYLDSNPNKSLELCKLIEEKYKDNDEVLKKAIDLKEFIKGEKNMKLIETYANKKKEYIINNKEDLIESLKDYVRAFLPEYNDLALDIFEEGNYDLLIKGLDSCYKKPFLDVAIGIFKLFSDMTKMDAIEDIINKLHIFNEYLKRGKMDIVLSFEK